MAQTWSVVTFGKHKGKTLPWIVLHDPDWFFWACEKAIFRSPLTKEATHIQARAKSIRILDPHRTGLVAEYIVHRPTGKLGAVHLVPASQAAHEGSSPAWRRKVIDLSAPREIAPYDKKGCAILIRDTKEHFFGKSKFSETNCQAFFDNDSNFELA